MLVDDHVLSQPEPGRHVKSVADLADSSARTADQHHLAQRRGARRGSADDSASVVNLLDAFGERRAPQTGRDLELIAAGEEDRSGVGEHTQPRIFRRFVAMVYAQMLDMLHAHRGEELAVDLPQL